MTTQKIIPLNRVEGDLEIHLELDAHNVVVEARSVGTMYRGIENLMVRRAPLDSLVITPRICGICTTAHLNAAAKALDMAFGATVPSNGQRVRNITLLVEHLQNDLRHLFLLFMPDCTHANYAHVPLYQEALQRYAVLKGRTTLATIRETKKILEIIAILGGQWPHSSFMVPGGVVSVPSGHDIAQCRYILKNFRRWYEEQVLGCALERWRQVHSWSQAQAWLEESPAHKVSELGFFMRFGLAAGLDRLGRGHDRFISAGGPDLPVKTQVKGLGGDRTLLPAGIFTSQGFERLDPAKIVEDISHAFYSGEACADSPFVARTVPEIGSADGSKYSWAKAPRYDGLPAETGALADLLVAGEPLFVEWVQDRGGSVFVRELARLVRPAIALPAMEQWLLELAAGKSLYYNDFRPTPTSQGLGLVPAPRGLLGHWVSIREGLIDNYQVITPTAWNASPRDINGVRGPWEEALIGTIVRDPQSPVEVEQIVRSFDPCLVCTVHAIQK